MKLIKIENNFYIINSSKINIGDLYLNENNGIRQYNGENSLSSHCMKILYSTNPSGTVKPISELDNCQEFFDKIGFWNVVVNGKYNSAEYYCIIKQINPDQIIMSNNVNNYETPISIYTSAYNQCLEDNKHKLYTIDDIIKQIDIVKKQYKTNVDSYGKPKQLMKTLDSVIENLKNNSKTLWNIEIVNNNIKLV